MTSPSKVTDIRDVGISLGGTSNLSLYGMWAYPWVVSPSNLSLFRDDRLVPG